MSGVPSAGAPASGLTADVSSNQRDLVEELLARHREFFFALLGWLNQSAAYLAAASFSSRLASTVGLRKVLDNKRPSGLGRPS
jgi:hypothetical protein